jgi:HlyD family secretion protein
MVIDRRRDCGWAIRWSPGRTWFRMRLKLLIAVILLVVGIGVVGYAVLDPPSGTATSAGYITATAAVADVVKQAVATGAVAAHATYGLGFGRDAALVPSGATSSGASSSGTWLVTSVAATLGDSVKQGDVLAVADDTDARLSLSAATSSLASAQARLATDQAKPTADDVASAKASLQAVQMSLDNATQSLADTKAQNAISLQQARQALNQARNQLTTDTNAAAASATLTADQRAVTSASTALDSAQQQVASSLHKAQQAVDSATLALTVAQQAYTAATAPTTADTIASDHAAVASAQQTVAAAQKAADGARIVAPADGLVIAVALAVGAPAPAGDAIALQTGPMEVTAQFAEADLASLALEQPATVTITALGQQLDGTVTAITPASTSSGTSSVVTYPVTITLSQPPEQVRSGMTASVAVTTASANGIAVPAIALQGGRNGYTVRVLGEDGSVTSVPVQVGLVSSTMAEITSGIDAGATVVVGSTSTRQGTTTTTGGAGGLGGLGGFPVGGGTYRGRGGN